MTITFTNVGRYKLNWSQSVGPNKPTEVEVVRFVRARRGAVASREIQAEYLTEHSGEIFTGGRTIGEFEINQAK